MVENGSVEADMPGVVHVHVAGDEGEVVEPVGALGSRSGGDFSSCRGCGDELEKQKDAACSGGAHGSFFTEETSM